MAKANLACTRIGNDGYEYARREDGQWFTRHGYIGPYGWARTKWAPVKDHAEEDTLHVDMCLKAHANGETSYIVGFGSLVVITDGKGLRLP